MAGKKRAHSSTNSIYKLKVFRFCKSYDSKSGDGPKARSGHRIVCNEKSMFSVGGFNPKIQPNRVALSNAMLNNMRANGTVFHEVWQFNFDSRIWKKFETSNMPHELASCAATMSGNLLFLYGGTGIPFGVKINEEVYVCNLSAPNPSLEFSLLEVEGHTKPLKQYGQSIAVNGTYLYTVGGTDGYVYSIDVYRLDLRTKIWEKLNDKVIDADEPSPRYRQEVVLFNDYLVVFGGGKSDAAFDLKEIPAFHLKKQRWETFETIGDETRSDAYPDERRCHACVQSPHDPAIVFVNGGVNENEIFSDTWRLDLRSLRWTLIRSLELPYGIYFHSAASTPEGKMVIFGGVTQCNEHTERTADVYTAWITVPKLKYACWDAILHYVRDGTLKIPKDLRKLGLPRDYETRLKSLL